MLCGKNTELVKFIKYHKINSIYKRDMEHNKKRLKIGEFSCKNFEYLQNNEWEFTEKVDGMNVRVLWDGENFRFGGRTDNAQMPMALIEELNLLFEKDKFREQFRDVSVMIYGEGYGGKIQAGGKYSSSVKFVVFDVLIGNFWLLRDDMLDICIELGLDYVPMFGCGSLLQAVEAAQSGISSFYGDFEAEGIVAKPVSGVLDRSGRRIITKIKAVDFK